MFLSRIFGEPVENNLPKGWFVEFVNDVGQRVSGHTPNQEHPEYWDGGIKWVSLADSNKLDKIYIADTSKKISNLGIQNSSAAIYCVDMRPKTS